MAWEHSKSRTVFTIRAIPQPCILVRMILAVAYVGLWFHDFRVLCAKRTNIFACFSPITNDSRVSTGIWDRAADEDGNLGLSLADQSWIVKVRILLGLLFVLPMLGSLSFFVVRRIKTRMSMSAAAEVHFNFKDPLNWLSIATTILEACSLAAVSFEPKTARWDEAEWFKSVPEFLRILALTFLDNQEKLTLGLFMIAVST